MVAPATPSYLKWSQTALTVGQSDHPTHIATAGRCAGDRGEVLNTAIVDIRLGQRIGCCEGCRIDRARGQQRNVCHVPTIDNQSHQIIRQCHVAEVHVAGIGDREIISDQIA